MISKSSRQVRLQRIGQGRRPIGATRAIVSTFGVFAGLGGFEHGIGEILQGNRAPGGIVIASWPGSELFRILAGEPAMTIVPNLLAAGILTVFFSLVFLIWATVFVQRKNGGLILIPLSIVMLLVGGGFGPPLLGIIIGIIGTRIHAPLSWWRAHLPVGVRRFLGKAWPWCFISCGIAWLVLFPGFLLLGRFFGADSASPASSTLLPAFILAAFGLLPLTALTGFAHDIQREERNQSRPGWRMVDERVI
jgi:hypothetical protein